MRLHWLTVTAFGPFADTQVVDFDGLTTAGLFLFSGPTGAGKTSVLDAVCFALYGQVPGARQGTRSLRSDHAEPTTAPEVCLEVTLRDRRLRVTRSPAWLRPKQRGAGTVQAQAQVLLEEQSGPGWITRSTRLDEAGQLLGDLLGLTLAQFCQVVLLPQGQFADFLRADADRRRVLLETLFDTRRFSAVEAWLVARRQETARCLDEADADLRALLARVDEAAGTDLVAAVAESTEPAPPADRREAGEAGAWVDALLVHARGRQAAADQRVATCAEHAAATAAALAEARALAVRQQRARSLQRRMAAVEAAAADHHERSQELALARQVAPAMALLDQADALRRQLSAAQKAATAGFGALPASISMQVVASGEAAGALRPTGSDGAGAGLPAGASLTVVARRTRDEVAALGVAAEQEEATGRFSAELETLLRRVVQLDAEHAETTAWLESAVDRAAELEQARDAARDAAARLPALAEAHDRATARLAAARRRDHLAREVGAARDEVRARTDQHQQARDRELGLRARRLDGMAGELAAQLRTGEPCPVCGGTEHPRPAAGADIVTVAEEQAAQSETAAADKHRRAAEEILAAREAERAAATADAGGRTSEDDLVTAVEQTTAARVRMAALADTLPGREAVLAAFRTEREQRMQQQVALDSERETCHKQIGSLRQQVDEMRSALDRARGQDGSVGERRTRLGALASRLEDLAGALTELEALRRALDDVTSGAHRLLGQLPLTGRPAEREAQARAAARSGEELDALEAACRHHEAEATAVRDQLADPDVLDALRLPVVTAETLDALAVEAGGAESARATAVTVAHAAARQVASLERLHAAVLAAEHRRVPLATEHRTVDHLSRLAEGKSADNALRMSLSGYVLAARLEQVAACASERLLRMSSGRFTLVHSDAGGGGRARGGLALRVLDAWTGLERDPATLSGGESFSASLALALGLADVVTGEAGGALLETLFVDEGFGSLDDETLDEVMGVLDDLRDGGRTVGIVSHVADLRQRIPTQLRITKGRCGSRISGPD